MDFITSHSDPAFSGEESLKARIEIIVKISIWRGNWKFYKNPKENALGF
jgi:hypothetical protein